MGTNGVIDIDLSATSKKKFRIDGDDNKIIELNVSDLNVMGRLREVYGKLNSLALKGNEVQFDEEGNLTEEALDAFTEELTRIDKEMRELVDYVFNAPVSAVCVDDGSMYDPFNGMFRFEYIFEKLLAVYEKNFDSEFKKMSSRVQKHTNKYTKKG